MRGRPGKPLVQLAGLSALYVMTATPVAIMLAAYIGKQVSGKFQLLEAVLIIGTWAGICLNRPLFQKLAEAPKRYLIFMGVLFWLLLAGQLTHKNRLTYPFQSFDMYSKYSTNLVGNRLSYIEIFGVKADGRRVRVSPALMYRPLFQHNRIANFLLRKATRAMTPSPRQAEDLANWQMVSQVLLEAYNKRHPGEEIVSLDSEFVLLPEDPAWPLENVEKRFLIGSSTLDPGP